MKDLNNYVPDVPQFELPENIHFPEVIFADCTDMEEVKARLAEHFITVQQKDVVANRIMDDFEISALRANYGEIAEEQLPELYEQMETLKAEFSATKKEYEARIAALNVQFKDLVHLTRKGVKDHPLTVADTFRIPVQGYYLYYSWLGGSFRLALVQEIPKHEYGDLFNAGGCNEEAFRALGYELPEVADVRINVRLIPDVDGGPETEVWEENGCDVWLEKLTEDVLDEDTGEVISTGRYEWHKVPFGESPWRKDDGQVATQAG